MPKNKKRQNIKGLGKCVFCEGGAVPGNKMTREHLWSDWMGPLLPSDSKHHEFRATFTADASRVLREAISDRQGAAQTKKIKVVCQKCNSGWMSEMETEVKQALTPLILGRPIILSTQMQQTICEWIALKLLVAEHDTFGGHPADPIFPQATRTEFMGSPAVPFGFRIWAAPQIGVKWQTGFFIHTSTLTFSLKPFPKGQPKVGPRNTQAFCWGIGRVFFYIIATTNPTLYHGMELFGIDNFVTLWPRTGQSVLWPAGKWFTDESLDKMPMTLQNLATILTSDGA